MYPNKFYILLLLPQLHLQEGGLHADINGDGVLDHVQVCVYFFLGQVYSLLNVSFFSLGVRKMRIIGLSIEI